jgi:hypothetical protein
MAFSKTTPSFSSISTETWSWWGSTKKTYESLEKGINGTHRWTYINQPVEYRVIASDKKATINSMKNGKKLEVDLINDTAKKVRNLLEKMDLPISPTSPIKPIMSAPIMLSFDDAKENQNKLDAYRKECQEKTADYQKELADYKKEAKLYPLRQKAHEAARVELINFLGKVMAPNS